MGDEPLTARPGRLDVVVAALTGATRADVQRAIAGGLVLVDGARRPKSFRLLGGEAIEVDSPPRPAIGPEGPAVPVRYRGRAPARDREARRARHPPHREPDAPAPSSTGCSGWTSALSDAGGPLPAGHRAPTRRGDERPDDRRVDGRGRALRCARCSERTRSTAGTSRSCGAGSRTTRSRSRPRSSGAARGSPCTQRAAARRRPRSRCGSDIADATLLEARPRTGRTHQIRVHLASVGHPILGDRAYGGAGDPARRLGLARPFLHSWRLALRSSDHGGADRAGGAAPGGPRAGPAARGRLAGLDPTLTSGLDDPDPGATVRPPANHTAVSCPQFPAPVEIGAREGRPRTMTDPFVHLHVHTEYSLLDGAARIEAPSFHPDAPTIFAEAERLGMPAIAITDHGSMFGALRFFEGGAPAGRQADHRGRGLRRARLAVRPQPRRERGEVPPPHAARRERDRLPQPAAARLGRAPRGLLPPAADGQGSCSPSTPRA